MCAQRKFFLDNERAAQNIFPWFFHRGILKFHDFSTILAFFSNSMIFPGLENAFFIFQVFHDFPWRWEPCIHMPPPRSACSTCLNFELSRPGVTNVLFWPKIIEKLQSFQFSVYLQVEVQISMITIHIQVQKCTSWFSWLSWSFFRVFTISQPRRVRFSFHKKPLAVGNVLYSLGAPPKGL